MANGKTYYANSYNATYGKDATTIAIYYSGSYETYSSMYVKLDKEFVSQKFETFFRPFEQHSNTNTHAVPESAFSGNVILEGIPQIGAYLVQAFSEDEWMMYFLCNERIVAHMNKMLMSLTPKKIDFADDALASYPTRLYNPWVTNTKIQERNEQISKLQMTVEDKNDVEFKSYVLPESVQENEYEETESNTKDSKSNRQEKGTVGKGEEEGEEGEGEEDEEKEKSGAAEGGEEEKEIHGKGKRIKKRKDKKLTSVDIKVVSTPAKQKGI